MGIDFGYMLVLVSVLVLVLIHRRYESFMASGGGAEEHPHETE